MRVSLTWTVLQGVSGMQESRGNTGIAEFCERRETAGSGGTCGKWRDMAGSGGTWREVAGHGRTAANARIACIAGDSKVLQGAQQPDVLHAMQLFAIQWRTNSKDAP